MLKKMLLTLTLASSLLVSTNSHAGVLNLVAILGNNNPIDRLGYAINGAFFLTAGTRLNKLTNLYNANRAVGDKKLGKFLGVVLIILNQADENAEVINNLKTTFGLSTTDAQGVAGLLVKTDANFTPSAALAANTSVTGLQIPKESFSDLKDIVGSEVATEVISVIGE